MKEVFAFLKKEWLEYTRSFKLYAMLLVFAALGFLNPILAKLMPELMESFLPKEAAFALPVPGVLDSWAQFFKNLPQIGMLVFLLAFGGILAGELSKGTLVNLITKGLSREKAVLVKWSFGSLCWSGCYWLSFGITYFYNLVFWEESQVPELFVSAVFVWVYGICLFSVLLFGSAVSGSFGGGLLGAGAVFLAGMVCSLFPKLEPYNPARLILNSMALLEGTETWKDFLPPLFLSLALMVLGVLGSVAVIRKIQI